MTEDFKRWSDDELTSWLSNAQEEFDRRFPRRKDVLVGSVAFIPWEMERNTLLQAKDLLRAKCDQLYFTMEDLLEHEYHMREIGGRDG